MICFLLNYWSILLGSNGNSGNHFGTLHRWYVGYQHQNIYHEKKVNKRPDVCNCRRWTLSHHANCTHAQELAHKFVWGIKLHKSLGLFWQITNSFEIWSNFAPFPCNNWSNILTLWISLTCSHHLLETKQNEQPPVPVPIHYRKWFA